MGYHVSISIVLHSILADTKQLLSSRILNCPAVKRESQGGELNVCGWTAWLRSTQHGLQRFPLLSAGTETLYHNHTPHFKWSHVNTHSAVHPKILYRIQWFWWYDDHFHEYIHTWSSTRTRTHTHTHTGQKWSSQPWFDSSFFRRSLPFPIVY